MIKKKKLFYDLCYEKLQSVTLNEQAPKYGPTEQPWISFFALKLQQF